MKNINFTLVSVLLLVGLYSPLTFANKCFSLFENVDILITTPWKQTLANLLFKNGAPLVFLPQGIEKFKNDPTYAQRMHKVKVKERQYFADTNEYKTFEVEYYVYFHYKVLNPNNIRIFVARDLSWEGERVMNLISTSGKLIEVTEPMTDYNRHNFEVALSQALYLTQ